MVGQLFSTATCHRLAAGAVLGQPQDEGSTTQCTAPPDAAGCSSAHMRPGGPLRSAHLIHHHLLGRKLCSTSLRGTHPCWLFAFPIAATHLDPLPPVCLCSQCMRKMPILNGYGKAGQIPGRGFFFFLCADRSLKDHGTFWVETCPFLETGFVNLPGHSLMSHLEQCHLALCRDNTHRRPRCWLIWKDRFGSTMGIRKSTSWLTLFYHVYKKILPNMKLPSLTA